jgi:hypothetical protein
MTITPQVGEQFTQQVVEQGENAITPQLVEQIRSDLFSVPWGHHMLLIEGTIPTIEEIEAKLSARLEAQDGTVSE